MTMRLWTGFGVLVWLLVRVTAASAQTLPLPPGAGYTWEHVGDSPQNGFVGISFDREGTSWISTSDCVAVWLDRSSGDAGRWIVPSPLPPRVCPTGGWILLGPHPPGGPARADTVLAPSSYYTRRSVDAGLTWGPRVAADSTAGRVIVEVPAGYPHAGRLIAGTGYYGSGYSDTRGETWVHSIAEVSDDPVAIGEILLLPPPAMLPGVASGRGAAAPPDWPTGRVVGTGNGGLVYSDTGGEGYTASAWIGAAGGFGQQLALVRRPDTHPLGPGPRLLLTGRRVGDAIVRVLTSDDAGVTWQQRAILSEPFTAPGYGRTLGLFALSEPGEADAGAGGRAVAVIGLGHIYETSDAGETWRVAGRAPAMSVTSPPDEPPGRLTNVGAAEMGPDGRLYIGVTVVGQGPYPGEWLYRTTEPFAVADEAGELPAASERVGVSVRPNPAGSRVEIVLRVSEAGSARVVVVDALGREVAVVLDGAVSAGKTIAALETGGWPVGVYVVRASVGSQVASARLVVAR